MSKEEANHNKGNKATNYNEENDVEDDASERYITVPYSQWKRYRLLKRKYTTKKK
jgi:hypothetical protein